MDTAWSSFADPTEDEWPRYLSTRRRQGFTCVLVSVLPIPHDRDECPAACEPFALNAEGHHDDSRLNDALFAQAREFARIAHEEHELRMRIGVLWNNHLPGTWGAARTPYTVMPDEIADSRETEVLLDLTDYLIAGWDLAERSPVTVDVVVDAGRTRLRQLPSSADQLLIAKRRP